MSHFSAVVIGEFVENQLAPYHEFECTGMDDKYVVAMDVTAQERSKYANEGYTKVKVSGAEIGTFAEYLQEDGYEPVPLGEEPNTNGEHRFMYYTVDEDGEVTQVIRRTNPNAHWDWWVVGGRWGGFFTVKEGATGALGEEDTFTRLARAQGEEIPEIQGADIARKGDIDFEGMREKTKQEANELFDKMETVGKPFNTSLFKPWEDFLKEVRTGNLTLEKARENYHVQPLVKAFFESEFFLGWLITSPVEVYVKGREDFVRERVNSVAIPYAIVKDGEWIAKGKMGWFGISNATEEEDAWNTYVSELYASLPDDALLTIVDCHI